MDIKKGDKCFLVPTEYGWTIDHSEESVLDTIEHFINKGEFDPTRRVLEVTVLRTMEMKPTLCDTDTLDALNSVRGIPHNNVEVESHCDNPCCKGGIGPHTRSECPHPEVYQWSKQRDIGIDPRD